MNKLKVFFISWWLYCLIAPEIIERYNILYDAGGWEGTFWFLTFFIGFPFGISGEYVGAYLPNYSETVQIAITYFLGSLIIFSIYYFLSKFLSWKKRTNVRK